MSSIVYSPITGTLVALEKVPDEAFSQNMMGEGVAIIPSESNVFAPFDGTIEVLPDTKHALGLMSSDGIELLIHVGLETVELNGKYYTMNLEEGSSFKKGDLLFKFDKDALQKEGYNIVTPVTVTNMENFTSLALSKNTQSDGTQVLAGDEIIVLK